MKKTFTWEVSVWNNAGSKAEHIETKIVADNYVQVYEEIGRRLEDAGCTWADVYRVYIVKDQEVELL